MLPDTHLASNLAASGPTRRHNRALFSAPLCLRHLAAGQIRTTRGITLDLSEGGIGALVEGSLEVGDAVDIEVELPTGKLDVMAIVRHTSNVQSGFEFLGLTAAERETIARVATPVEQPNSELQVFALPEKLLSVPSPRMAR